MPLPRGKRHTQKTMLTQSMPASAKQTFTTATISAISRVGPSSFVHRPSNRCRNRPNISICPERSWLPLRESMSAHCTHIYKLFGPSWRQGGAEAVSVSRLPEWSISANTLESAFDTAYLENNFHLIHILLLFFVVHGGAIYCTGEQAGLGKQACFFL